MTDDGAGGGLGAASGDAESRSRRPTTSSSEPCPETQRVRLVELVEVVTHSGTTTTRAPVSRDQFINLDDRVDAATAHPDYGRRIRLKARVEWVAGDRNRPLTGKTVYWYATAGGSNKAGLLGNERGGFTTVGSAAMRFSSNTGEDGWTPVVSFYLSRYGGDEFTISATDNSSYTGGRDAGPLTVWRKFWYQVTEMAAEDGSLLDLPAAVTTPFEAGYRAVYMRFLEEGTRARANHVANLPTGRNRNREAQPHLDENDHVPFKLHIMTIDLASRFGDHTVSDTMTTATYESPNWLFLWLRGDEPRPWFVRARFRPAGDLVWHCGRRTPACPGHGSRRHSCSNSSGTAWHCGARDCSGRHSSKHHRCDDGVWHCTRTRPACPGHSSHSHQCRANSGTSWNCGERNCPAHSRRGDTCSRAWQDIPDDKLSLVTRPGRRGFKKVAIDFSSGPVTPTSTLPVEFEVVVKKATQVALGWGGGSPSIYLCTGTLRDWFERSDWDDVQESDLVHEGGHALGMLNMTPSPGHAHDAWEDPDDDNHCVELPADCVMYKFSSTTRATTFHLDGDTGCHDSLRRQDYSRGSMSHWRF